MKVLFKMTLQCGGGHIQLCFSDKQVDTVILNVSCSYFRSTNTFWLIFK